VICILCIPLVPYSFKFNFLQREELRARFPGVPGDLVNFFLYVAEEVIFFSALIILMEFLHFFFFFGLWVTFSKLYLNLS
jgi:hypothetical protein